jgi:hypothetical protein
VRLPSGCGTLVVVTLFAPLVLIGPLMLLASAVVWLWAHGPLGWVAAVLLVAGVAGACRWLVRVTMRWWRSTKAPEQPQVRPSDLRGRAPR